MKIRMIYLAAGNSRRFGSNKLFHEINGKPMFTYGFEALTEVLEKLEETSLTVVTNFPRIEAYVQRYTSEHGKKPFLRKRIRTAASPESHRGISRSIRAGLMCFDTDLSYEDKGEQVLCPDADYYLFCVADQPYISSRTIIRLLEETVEKGCAGGFVEWKGAGGNPAVFSGELFPELLALTGDSGGKKLLAGRENVCRVSAEREEELKDIDVLEAKGTGDIR